jgi:hypothetical protein
MIIHYHADFPNRFVSTADGLGRGTMVMTFFSALIAAAAVQAPCVFRYPARAALIRLGIGALLVIVSDTELVNATGLPFVPMLPTRILRRLQGAYPRA